MRDSALGALLLLLLWPSAAEARKDGEIVRITGQVLDTEGLPVPDVTAVLEASRVTYSFWKRERVSEPPLLQTVTVGEDGRFELEWQWDRHHNHFELAIGLEVTRGGEPGFEMLQRVDLTEDMHRSAPVQVTLTVERAGYVRWLQRYLADRATADEEKIYREAGRPDRIKEEGDNSSWWYFKTGKMYRFEHGTLQQVIHFDPMETR